VTTGVTLDSKDCCFDDDDELFENEFLDFFAFLMRAFPLL